MKVQVFNLIILDESGSMNSIRQAALSGLNETLQTVRTAQQKYADGQEHFVSLVTFNSNGTKQIFDLAPAAQIRELTASEYEPDCSTPLYDTMGFSIARLRSQIDKNMPHEVLVTVITDGYENASCEFTGKMLKQLVQEMKADGWTFAYIGANQDVDAVADSIGVTNKMSYAATDSGIRFAFCRVDVARESWYGKVSDKSKGLTVNMADNFFDGTGDDTNNPPEEKW
jgi:Mg-chelatase subunit ChlD